MSLWGEHADELQSELERLQTENERLVSELVKWGPWVERPTEVGFGPDAECAYCKAWWTRDEKGEHKPGCWWLTVAPEPAN